MAKKPNVKVIRILEAENFDYKKARKLYQELSTGRVKIFPLIPQANDIIRLRAQLEQFRTIEIKEEPFDREKFIEELRVNEDLEFESLVKLNKIVEKLKLKPQGKSKADVVLAILEAIK